MEIIFQKTSWPCLSRALQEVQNAEQTLEIRLPEGMGDVGRILGAWGQPIARGKEWHSDYLSFTGGMMVWVLYQPEDGGAPQCLEGWIPFQMRWELPEGTRDGEIRLHLRQRFVDARCASARRIMVRAGLGVLAEALVRQDTEVFLPGEAPGEVELRRETFPVRTYREAGEKTFLLQEELSMGDASAIQSIVYCNLSPEITERKVLTNKVVFRGNAKVHMVCLGTDGELHSREYPLAFSQLAELEDSYDQNAQVDISPIVTSLEAVPEEDGTVSIKCGLVGQYLVDCNGTVEVVTDAYAPGREVQLETKQLELPVLLDTPVDTLEAETQLESTSMQIADMDIHADLPQLRMHGDSGKLELNGTLQALFMTPDQQLEAESLRWEQEMPVRAAENTRLMAVNLDMTDPRQEMAGEKTKLRWSCPVKMTATATTQIPMVTAIELGEKREPKPDRPSLIIRRATEQGLWEMAKETDSTVDAIRQANQLTGEPQPGQMLLIPVKQE